MVRVALALLACLVLAGCTRPAPTPHVTVEPLASGDWRATWHAQAPVEALRFVRAAGYLREREWRVLTPGYAFGRDGDAQTLVLAPGAAAADTIVVEFPRNTDTLERDYELFNTFTDGSVALFAGHFAVKVNGDATIDRVRVTAPPGQHAIGQDYVYVGTLKPVIHEHMITILDPGLPRWLARTLLDYTPRVLEVYADRTGHALPGKPLVLFSYDPSAHRRDVNGSRIGGQLQLRALGDGWVEDDPYAVRAALHLIAHEAAHLWNGYVSDAAANTAPWMHEGAADAFADAALVELGIVDERQLDAIRTDSLNDCLAGRRTHYTCGRMAAWWTERATGDLFAFWGALLERARANGDGYDADDYFAVLAERGATPGSVEALRDFVNSLPDNDWRVE